MKRLYLSSVACAALACASVGLDALLPSDEVAAAPSEHRVEYDSWPADRRALHDALPAEQQVYFWTLTPAQQRGWWALSEAQRKQVYELPEPSRAAAWKSIEDQLAAAGVGPALAPATEVVQANPRGSSAPAVAFPNPQAARDSVAPAMPADPTYQAGPYKGALTPPPPQAMNKTYPVCTRTRQDSCQNPGEGGAPGRSRALSYWPGKPASE